MRIRALAPLAVLTLTLLVAAPALADVMIEKKSTNEPSGMPESASEQTSTSWIGEGRVAEISGDDRVVILAGEKLMIIDDASKTYNTLALPIDFAKLAPGMEEMLEQFASQLQLKIEVVPTEDSREINGFPTKRSQILVASAVGVTGEIDVWLTEKVDFDLAAMRKMTKDMTALAPPGIGDVFKKISELKGFPILQEITMSMMGQTIHSREEVISVTRKDAPKGIYDVPETYVETPYDPMAAMTGR